MGSGVLAEVQRNKKLLDAAVGNIHLSAISGVLRL